MKQIFLSIIVLLSIFNSCSNQENTSEYESFGDTFFNQYRGNLLKDYGNYYILGGDILLDKNDQDQKELIGALLGESNDITKGIKETSVNKWPAGVIIYST